MGKHSAFWGGIDLPGRFPVAALGLRSASSVGIGWRIPFIFNPLQGYDTLFLPVLPLRFHAAKPIVSTCETFQC